VVRCLGPNVQCLFETDLLIERHLGDEC
jgi:hypothetical protein